MSRGFFIFFASLNLFLFSIEHTRALAQERSFTRRIFFPSPIAVRVPLRAQPRVPSSLRCCPPNISSILADHDEVFELPGYPRRAGNLINRPVTFRTIPRFWHPRTGCTALLLLPAPTELLVINAATVIAFWLLRSGS